MSNIAAIMYDFDKTLSPKDMQDYAFSSEIGMPAEANLCSYSVSIFPSNPLLCRSSEIFFIR